jgi:hypothetical protein
MRRPAVSHALGPFHESIPLADDINLDYLSRALPDVPFEVPSLDAILSLYQLVVSQTVNLSLEDAHCDLEELHADNERKDIELDQSLQDCKSLVPSLEAQVKGLQEELVKVKQECDTLGESHAPLPNIYVIVY